jgi:pyruvate formate lyase activating enzyme
MLIVYPDYSFDELLADLKKCEGFIDGVEVSGGEPTIDTGLPAFYLLADCAGRYIGQVQGI